VAKSNRTTLALLLWHTGHATGGAPTYYILKKNNPARVNKISATLTLHPWYNTKWHDKIAGLSPQQKEVSLFMLASTSPDDARRTHYERPTWYYTDYLSRLPARAVHRNNRRFPTPKPRSIPWYTR
jgi:hypothetical protein